MAKAIYLHQNGSLIKKLSVVYENDPGYFISPLVMKVWRDVDQYDKNLRKAMLRDAIIKGALPLEVKRVGLENGLSDSDIEDIRSTRR